jgi:hypothetical protein
MTDVVQTGRESDSTLNRELRPAAGWSAVVWLLSILFAARVLGQALQRWMPLS